MALKVSPTMQKTLDNMREHGGLERWQGGFWTYPGCAIHHRMEANRAYPEGVPVPAWWVDFGTVKALLKRELIEITERDAKNQYAKKAKIMEGRAGT